MILEVLPIYLIGLKPTIVSQIYTSLFVKENIQITDEEPLLEESLALDMDKLSDDLEEMKLICQPVYDDAEV